ncbi:MAG: M3 family oligoendopeptidase [Anaerolineales bacterium]|jgi:pepF/M3 family oligoendopeptidase
MSKDSDLPRWDLGNVYPGLDSPEFKEAFQTLGEMLDDLDEYIYGQNIDPTKAIQESDSARLASIIEGFIDQMNAAWNLSETLRAYINSFVSTDSYNETALKAMSEWQKYNVKLNLQRKSIFRGWVGKLEDRLPEILENSEIAQAHSFFLSESIQQSKYMMSPAEEELAGELSLSGIRGWEKLQRTITTQLNWEIKNEDGEIEKMPITAILNLRSHPNEVMRRWGYEAEQAAWKSVENQLAACMNGVKGSQNTLNTRRGREDPVHFSIDLYRIDRMTLNAMLGAMKDSFPLFRKYFQAKAKQLGKKRLPWWDLFAPLGKTERVYSYDEAMEFVLDNFAKFSGDLADYAKRAFDNNWIDVGPRDGKRAGAFCMYVPGVRESRILTNYDGSLDGIFTVAHELGHGYHNECRAGKTMLQRDTPYTLGETASVMCETIVTEAAIKEASDEDERLAILETSLIGDSQVVVDIYSRYLFEKEVFERRAQADLSAEELCEIMERAQKETYGDSVDEDTLHKYMWTWKPHYYIPGISFYNYPYAFGLLFSTGLYAIYKERGDAFIPEYRDLLASTGQGTAADLAARFDLDLRSPEFWEGSLAVIGEKIERYVEL